MKVLVVSEGQHELGRDDADDTLGALTTLVCRIASKKLVCETMNVRDPAFAHSHGSGGRLFKRAMRCLLYAAENGFDALVFVIDQDDDPGRRQSLDRAQVEPRGPTGRAFGLAVRSFDAWIIADEQAITQALGRVIQRQPAPEEIKEPKEHCRRLRGDSDLSLAEFYRNVAMQASIATIEQRCPHGFAPFVERVRKL